MADDDRSFSRRAMLGLGLGAISGCTATGYAGRGAEGDSPTVVRRRRTATPRPTAEPTPEPEPPTTRLGTDLGDPFEWFADAGRWSGRGDTRLFLDDGTATADSPSPARGERSMGVRSPGRAEVVGDFSEDPLDFRERSLSVGLYADAPDRQPTFYLSLHAPDADNAVRYDGVFPGDEETGWERFDLSVDRVEGSPDLSSVEKVRMWVSTGERTRFWVDDFRAMPRPDRGKVMLIFDDISASQYDIGHEVLSAHGIRGAYAVITGLVGEEDRISLEALNDAEADGWELVSHSVTGDPLTALDRETRRRYLAESKRWLREHAENPAAAEHLVFPLSSYDEGVLRDASDHYEMMYVGGKGSSAALSDHRTVVRENWEEMSDDSLLDAVDRAAERRELLVYVLHGIKPEQRPRLERLARHLSEAVEAGRVDNVTPTELAALQERLAKREAGGAAEPQRTS